MNIKNKIKAIRKRRHWIDQKMDSISDAVIAEQIFCDFESVMEYISDTLSILADNKCSKIAPVTTMDRVHDIIDAAKTEE